MTVLPEFNWESHMDDVVHRLNAIVADPALWCRTDVQYVEDAARIIEVLRQDVSKLRSSLERIAENRNDEPYSGEFAADVLKEFDEWVP